MEHRAHGRNGQIGLQVGLVVPQERADPVRVADAQTAEGLGQLLGPAGHLGVGGATDSPSGPTMVVTRLAP